MGLDLLDFFRGRYSWSKLLRLIEHLPWHSAYKKALADDDEIATRLLEQRRREEAEARRTGRKAPAHAPISVADWDPEREQTAQLSDALSSLRLAVMAPNMPKGKRPKAKPAPRPETAMARAERRAEMAQHKSIVAQVLRKE